MSSGPKSVPPWRGPAAPSPPPPGPAWRAPPARTPYRPKWRRLALVGLLAIGVLAAVTWVVLWMRPPEPARVVILSAGYDRTLAVPPNPYGKAGARNLGALARPGSWFGSRSRLAGGPVSPLSRLGMPDLSNVREKCVVVFIAAHGGRDQNGAFLFPEDSLGESSDRVRVKTILDQLAKLPARKQKLLIIDATYAPAYTELGLVHNDFAAAVEEMDAVIAAVPNLAVFLSSGPDERSWCSPEWGTSAFAHFLLAGLNGAADADGNRRVTAAELVSYVRPNVTEWARDNRAARQVPVLLPKRDGEARAAAMHLVSVDDKRPAAPPAPEPFNPPPELEAQWTEYRDLSRATPPPTAYTPHLWRQYEAWVLRHEELLVAGDADGAKVARANAAEIRRKIEQARSLDVSPQTLALPAAVGGQPFVASIPEAYAAGIIRLAGTPVPDRAKVWAELRGANDSESARLLWVRALIEWTAVDPVAHLPTAAALIPLVGEGFAVRPAELNFLAMLARHLPPADKKDILGPLLTKVLLLRVQAEQFAAGFTPGAQARYPFAEVVPWPNALAEADAARRAAEDLCFATDEGSWRKARTLADDANAAYARAAQTIDAARGQLSSAHRSSHRAPGAAEWNARFRSEPPTAAEFAAMLQSRPEFEGKPTPRADAVAWLHRADALFTAPPPDGFDPAQRVALAREFRRVSRQLLVTNETRPQPLPEVSAAKAREIAFEAARRRGELLLARFGPEEQYRLLAAVRPGENPTALNDRLSWFAFRADGRQSLALFGARTGELFDAATALANDRADYRSADRWVRLSPAHAPVSDEPINRVRRERVRSYLALQARRTFADHWYGEGGSRYYFLAAQKLKSDADAIYAADVAADPFTPYLRAESPFPVRPDLPERFSVTDEPDPEARVPFVADATDGVAGYPVFWLDPKQRTPVSTTPGGAVFVRKLTRPAPPVPLTPKAQTEPLAVAGFFRGRTLGASAPVDYYAVPGRAAVRTPLPTDIGIAVRADTDALKRYGFGHGAVAIVLDCSGSMARDPRDPNSVGLYPAAVVAFEKLLKGLPPGTVVTVWTFGPKTIGVKTAEETIRELLPPTELPLDTAPVFDEVLKQVREFEPWHESPIVRTAVAAKNRIKAARVPFKTVVLISDAADTRFADDPEYGGKGRTIPDVLRDEFEPAEVALAGAVFAVNKEEQPVQDAFKSAAKFRTPGLFVAPDKVDVLIEWLRAKLNIRVRVTLGPPDPAAPPTTDLAAGPSDSEPGYTPVRAPGAYRLRVRGAPDFARDIWLSPGDRLLLDLTADRGTLALRRHWYADTEPAVRKAGAPDGPWRLALWKNRADGSTLNLLAAIDANPAKLYPLTVSQVGDVWFEVAPQGADPDVAVRWHATGGFPAPAWALDSPGWPKLPGGAPAAPKVSAWWSPTPFAHVAELPASPGGVLDVRSRPHYGIGARVETVTLEEHVVEVEPGKFERRRCLVVRMSHAPGEPVFARARGVVPAGAEVRVYADANKTTTLYWWPGLDAASVKTNVTGLEFVLLSAAKADAERNGRTLMLIAPTPTK